MSHSYDLCQSTSKPDTRVTFDVAAEDGSGFTPWDLDMVRKVAEDFAAKVAASDPEATAVFCDKCPKGDLGDSPCPHGAPSFRFVAVGNLRLQPM